VVGSEGRIALSFADLRSKGEKALIGFLAAGHPSSDLTLKAMIALQEAGTDIIELGVPFSDPIADGPVNQAAYARAIEQGFCVEDVFGLVKDFRKTADTPVALMTYCNPVAQMGWREFAGQCAQAGVDGVIAVDLPVDEAEEWVAACRANGVDTIFLLAPTSSAERMRKVAEQASGFIYCVSRTGVTGPREHLPADLPAMVAKVRALTDKPLAVGFGISTPQQVADVCRVADGAVVGSALVEIMGSGAYSIENLRTFVSSLKEATRSP
jgi:tryptophan synthase alpha chain